MLYICLEVNAKDIKMKRLIEAVPNFSEGKDVKVIDAIVDSIISVSGVKLLHVDRGESANRTVFTFAGSPENVVEASFRSAKIASELIDMRLHKGTHPRLGALDVMPLVPISGVTLEECAEYALKLAARIGNELHVPVYCYESASKLPYRTRLEQVRKGEYEGLAEKMKLPEWKPDFGPSTFNAKSGAFIVGARPFLLAYNINLATPDESIAKKIAAIIRESGRVENGIQISGKFKTVKAIGWYVPEFECAQVSTNLTNLKQTGVHEVYEEVCKLAKEFGTSVTGSELIGLTPRFALLDAGKHYNSQLSDIEKIKLAIKQLKLNDKKEFHTNRIIENLLKI